MILASRWVDGRVFFVKRVLIAGLAIILLFVTGVIRMQRVEQIEDEEVLQVTNIHDKTDLEHFVEGIRGMGMPFQVDQKVTTLKVKLGVNDAEFWGSLVGQEVMPNLTLADLAVLQVCEDHVHVLMYLIPTGQEIPEQPERQPNPHNAEGVREKVLRGGAWA